MDHLDTADVVQRNETCFREVQPRARELSTSFEGFHAGVPFAANAWDGHTDAVGERPKRVAGPLHFVYSAKAEVRANGKHQCGERTTPADHAVRVSQGKAQPLSLALALLLW